MKKILFFILITSYAFGYRFVETPGSYKFHVPYEINGKCDQIIQRKAYVSCYSYKDKIPLYVAYRLDDVNKKSLKRPKRFYYDKSIPTDHRSKVQHYKRTGYDRGHMIPNGAVNYDRQSQYESFLLSNIVPQHPKLNRDGWRYLEEFVRDLVIEHGTIYVITGAIPGSTTLKKGCVSVPSRMYKIIYIPTIKKTIVILVPNAPIKRNEILMFRSTLKEIENLSGFTFRFDLIKF